MSCEIMALAFVFLMLSHLLPFVTPSRDSYECLENGNYTSNSTYKANLDDLLSTLPANIDPYGFYSASVGQIPDRANAIVLCRGDVEIDACRECVRDAAVWLTTSACPHRKQANAWYRDSKCMLRYSNETIYGTQANSEGVHSCSLANATNQNQFKKTMKTLLNNLRSKAADGGSRKKFATGNLTGPDLQTIFALVQCTPDLDKKGCDTCLTDAIDYIGLCEYQSEGGRVVMPRCGLQFDIYSFFNERKQEELAPAAAAPLPQTLDRSRTGKVGVYKYLFIVMVCTVVAVFIVMLIAMRRKQNRTRRLEPMHEISTSESLQYKLCTIRAATNDFSAGNKLGQGGFGVVYKGVLPNGREIAVKRLSKDSGQGSVEFKTEVLLLAKLLHKNLVRLLGFCVEGTEKLIVYEHVRNGSLDRFIFNPEKCFCLDWNKRFDIIWSIARGLLYLHEDSQLKIIHRDLKASNVLLDSTMSPKISDFGMAKLFEQDETHGNTSRIAGTYGYMPPEYAINGQFSVKSDVFSFGVLILEVVTGRKNTRTGNEESAPGLLSLVWKMWHDGMHASVVDPFLRSDSALMSDIVRCIHIGLLCVQQNPADRPTMASVVLMLRCCSITMALPSQPAFYVGSGHGAFQSSLQENSSNGHTPSAHSGENASGSYASITQQRPR